uniref:cysteine dioxygenase n=1 Tax=Oryza rufipogon TaxID=4529 RepID=A0A0E0NZ13_ORYRU
MNARPVAFTSPRCSSIGSLALPDHSWLVPMAGISACASFPVVAVDSALRPEAVEGQGAAATAVAAPKTVTESESSASASASMEPEEQVEEPAKKRKRDPAPDVGSSSMDGTDGQGSDDDKNDDGEEAPVLQAVSPPRQNALQRLVDECRVLLDGSSKSTQPPNSTTVSRIVALLTKNTKLVKKVLDHVVEAGCGTWVLYPSTGGNLHRFVAGVDGPCAFLDVLTPPYSEGRLRRCTFYRDYPFQLHRNHRFARNLSAQEKSQFAWLRPINASAPPDLRIVPLTYSGPPVV